MKLYNIILTGILVVLTLSNSLLALRSMDFVYGIPGIGESLSREYPSLDVPKTIPDLSTITSTLTITDTFTIKDVNVKIDISHIWVSDLDVYLIAPDGTRIELFTDVGGMGIDFTNTILDDEADESIVDGEAPFTGSYRPESYRPEHNECGLSILDGSDINGTWMLEVTDDAWLISGVLNSWSLIIDPIPTFEDTFPSTTIDSTKWPIVDSAAIDDTAGDEPSPPYALHLRNSDSVISKEINLSEFQSAELVFSWKRMSTESGDDLAVDYWDGNNWQNLLGLPGGEDTDWNQESCELPPDALHSQFRLCLQAMCSSYYDNWYVDDVEINSGPEPFHLLGSTSFLGRNYFSLVELQMYPIDEQLIGPSSFYSGMDFNPQGVLYGASSSLYIIDPTDGSYTTVGTIHSLTESSILMRSISFAPDGILYGVSSWDQELYIINPVTAFATKVCDMVDGIVFGIEFCEDGTLYGAFADLYIIDPTTCQVMKIGDLPDGVYVTELDCAPDGFIYAVDDYDLYQINPLDGSATFIGAYDSELSTVASDVLTQNGAALMGDVPARPGRYSMAGITMNNATKETGQDAELHILEEQALEADRQHAIQSMR